MNDNANHHDDGQHGDGMGGFTMTGCPVAWCQNGPGHDGVHLGPETDLHGLLTVQRLLHPNDGHALYVVPSLEDAELGHDDVMSLADDLERVAVKLRALASETD